MSVDASGDALLSEILAACEAGGNVDDYCALRAGGVEHGDALAVLALLIGVDTFLMGWRAGFSYNELVMAFNQRLNYTTLIKGREAGLTFGEMAGKVAGDVGLSAYVAMREAGATHDEVSEVSERHGQQIGDYANLRASGTNHREAVGVLNVGISVRGYLGGREAGLGHRAALRAERNQVRLVERMNAEQLKAVKWAAKRSQRARAKMERAQGPARW